MTEMELEKEKGQQRQRAQSWANAVALIAFLLTTIIVLFNGINPEVESEVYSGLSSTGGYLYCFIVLSICYLFFIWIPVCRFYKKAKQQGRETAAEDIWPVFLVHFLVIFVLWLEAVSIARSWTIDEGSHWLFGYFIRGSFVEYFMASFFLLSLFSFLPSLIFSGFILRREKEEIKRHRLFIIVVPLCMAMAIGAFTNPAIFVRSDMDWGNNVWPAIDCTDNLRTLDSAIAQYQAAEGAYPTTLEELIPEYSPEVPEEHSGGTYYIDTTLSPPRAACSEGHEY